MDAIIYKDTIYGGGGAMRGNYFNPIIYSTEEREVGVWTNDKPLYQKTFAFQLTGATSYLDLSPYDAEEIIHEEGRAVNDNGLYTLDLPYYENATYSVFTNYIKENMNALAFYAGSGIVSYYSNIIITLQYTKTTDVAGSGKYNTLGVPNVHYTTEEQVIGTWLGETLYGRTFNGLATNTNGDSWVNIGGIDASTWKDAVNVEIYCNSSDVNNKLTRIALGEARVFNGNVQVTTSVSYNRQINVATIQYTKITT